MLFEQYGVLGKMRIEIEGVLDVQLHEFLDPREFFKVNLFGADLHFAWYQWEYQFFEIYEDTGHQDFEIYF